ncbi:hypothetical protein D3C81_1583180 [compost metagenome]
MGQVRPRPGGGVVVELAVAGVGRLLGAIGQHSATAIALTQLHAMAVELVMLQLDGLFQGRSALAANGAVRAQLVQARPAFGFTLARLEAQGIGDRQHVAHAFHGPVHYLPANWLALLGVAVQQTAPRLPLEHQGQLPRQVVGVLHRGVGAQAVGRRMPVHGVAAAEHPSFGVVAGDHMVDLPLAGGEHLDRDIGVADHTPCTLDHGGFADVRLTLGGVVHE